MANETSAQRVERLNEFARTRHPDFLGTVREGGAIRGTAVPAHRGRSTQVWDVTVQDEANHRTIALFRCTQMVLLPRA